MDVEIHDQIRLRSVLGQCWRGGYGCQRNDEYHTGHALHCVPPLSPTVRARDDDNTELRNGNLGHPPRRDYSITSSARARRVGGIVRPSALAVLRLIVSSYRVACSTGRSEGLSPLRILST